MISKTYSEPFYIQLWLPVIRSAWCEKHDREWNCSVYNPFCCYLERGVLYMMTWYACFLWHLVIT